MSGWSESLPQGVILLLDSCGEAAAQWLPVLAGRERPASGQLPVNMTPEQVFWHNPRDPLAQPEQRACDWVQETMQRWPCWDAQAWEQHVEGFVLAPQLDKPLWHLSTGSLRKLWMAAAMASGARYTLIDEPVAGLDGVALRYLSKALDQLGEQLACLKEPDEARWIMVAHWEPLPGVTWDEVVEMPAAF